MGGRLIIAPTVMIYILLRVNETYSVTGDYKSPLRRLFHRINYCLNSMLSIAKEHGCILIAPTGQNVGKQKGDSIILPRIIFLSALFS